MDFEALKLKLRDVDGVVFDDVSRFLERLSIMISTKNNKYFVSCLRLPDEHEMSLIEGLYGFLVPFLVDSTELQCDIYCYDFEKKEDPNIVVFSSDGIVSRWESATDFIRWLKRAGE
ncbi:hypothetical protein KDX30_18030 [Pseudomonas sp. CDFA 553]|uniref:hypothetical protein n=1 Tax=Pseudomonas quasicaspiana TaxID=2829821 RepID=UPI001E349058|nr:hypothetical protein [Pseudomonas quasicaspiana]MCD5989795.1 hypothetical protein [Pseudomonas quasicaspiana]